MNHLVTALIIILEIIFSLGLIGSFLVLVLSTIEDLKVLLPERKHTQRPASLHGELEHSKV